MNTKPLASFMIAAIIIVLIYFLIAFMLPIGALAEETTELYVTTRILNGRKAPTTDSSREAYFELGETVDAIEVCSNGWVKCKGGETGIIWCKAEYLSESKVVRKWKNISGGSVNIRRNPSTETRREGTLKAGRVVRVAAEVFGWGYIKDQGWVDLSYFEVVDDGE